MSESSQRSARHGPGADPAVGPDHAGAFGAFFSYRDAGRDAGAQRRRRRVVTISVAVHFALILILLVRGYWTVHKLSPPKRSVITTASLVPFLEAARPERRPPSPAPPPKKGDGVRGESHDRRTVTAKKLVRPVASDAEPEIETEAVVAVAVEVDASDGSRDSVTGVSDGIVGGVVGGEPGGVLGGALSSLTGPERLKPPPAPPRPRRVAFAATELRRVAGTRNVLPSPDTIEQIKRDRKAMVTATVELCLSRSGKIHRVQTVKTSGYPAFDRKIHRHMKGWRYQPFIIQGAATPVCTFVHFIHREDRVSSL